MMLKKEEIYVSVESKKQAEIFRKFLEAMEEPVSTQYYPFNQGYQLRLSSAGNWLLGEEDNELSKITFGELIDLLQIKPLLISEDGVPIYDGDIYYVPQRGGLIGGNGYSGVIYNYTASSLTIRKNDKSKRFIKRENAVKWIEEQKQESLEVKISSIESVIVEQDKVILSGDIAWLDRKNIEAILKAMEELENGSKQKP